MNIVKKKISGCQGLEEEKDEHKVLRAVNPFCKILQWWISAFYTFVKTHRMYKNEP